MIKIQDIITACLSERCIFHSEADFQHHLTWHIHSEVDDAELRLEFPLSKDDSNRWEYCDILLKAPYQLGIELKYKTILMSSVVGDEPFELKNQGAQDIGRYDFLKDVSRLEHWCTLGRIDSGCAIILTNDHSYWTPPRNINTIDRDFRIHNRTVSGALSWGQKASTGTTKNREQPIVLGNTYSLEWLDAPCDGFKYLLIDIKKNANESFHVTA